MVKLGQRVEFNDPDKFGITGVSDWQGSVIEDEPKHVRVLWDYKPSGGEPTTGTFTRNAARTNLRVAAVEES